MAASICAATCRAPAENRAAGALAALGAAAWFDFFFTVPYYQLTIRSSPDVTTAVLLLVTGLAVWQLAAWARRLKVIAVTDEGYLATMRGTAAKAHSSRSPEEVADYVGTLLAGLLDLQDWRFEYGSLRSHPPRLTADGSACLPARADRRTAFLLRSTTRDRRGAGVVALSGTIALAVALVSLLVVSGTVPPLAGLALALVVVVAYLVVLGTEGQRPRMPARWQAWLRSAVSEEELELEDAIRPSRGRWPDAITATVALGVVIVASVTMERAASSLGRHLGVPEIITGYATSGDRVLPVGLGLLSSLILLAAAGPVAARRARYRHAPASGRVGDSRQLGTDAATDISPNGHEPPSPALAVPASRRATLLPKWPVRRLWAASMITATVIAAIDAAIGHHLILIGLLIMGPCIALLNRNGADRLRSAK